MMQDDLIGLEVLSERRIVPSALFALKILAGRCYLYTKDGKKIMLMLVERSMFVEFIPFGFLP
jgi:hypothetical protein